MVKKNFLTGFLFFILLTQGISETLHTIQKGETIYALSKKYNVPSKIILSYNKIEDATKIIVGQKIRIPDSGDLEAFQETTQVYIVKKGDTIYQIAKTFNTTQAVIFALNNLNPKSIIKPGQKIQVPKAPPTKPKRVVTQNNVTDKLRTYTAKKANTKILWPIDSKKISYLDDKTSGVMIEGTGGDTVQAIASGNVVSCGTYRGYANVIFIKSRNDYIYVYGGLQNIDVKTGTKISVGTKIGSLPEKALLSQSKLYFMVYKKNTPIDPALAPRGL